jgi:hypothetical protein
MKDELRRAFDAGTEAPHPSLRSALRARLEAGPAQEPPRAWRLMAGAALVAGVVGLAFVGGVALLPRGGGNNLPAPAATGSATPSAEPTANPTQTAVSPSPSAPVYFCGSASGGGSQGTTANVTGVRVGTGPGYDRLVIEFDGPVPPYSVEPQSASTFMEDPTGRQVVLLGQSGIRVVVNGATANPSGGGPTYTGPYDFKPGYSVLAEARQIGDFERVYSWGLGLNLAARGVCAHVFTLPGPDRLVIDVQQP